MLSDWDTTFPKVFQINKRWGIRDNTITDNPAVIVHRCSSGDLGTVHDLIRNNYKCTCHVRVPDDIQAIWLLRTCNTKNKYWMRQEGSRLNDKD